MCLPKQALPCTWQTSALYLPYGRSVQHEVCGAVQMATVLIYLSAPEEGGETVFPLEGEHGLQQLPTIDYRSCNEGLKVLLSVKLNTFSAIHKTFHTFLWLLAHLHHASCLCLQMYPCEPIHSLIRTVFSNR